MILLFTSCGNEKQELHHLSYLTTDIGVDSQETSHFSGTVISHKTFLEEGKVNLEVKMQSDIGERLEFLILDYKKNEIYPVGLRAMKASVILRPENTSSGTSRTSQADRLFIESTIIDMQEFREGIIKN